MKFRVFFLAALALTGCGHRVCCDSYASYGPPSGVVLSPASSVTSPANEPISSSFNLTPSERNYSANFHIAPVSGSCWVPAQNQIASGASFVMNASGTTCQSGKGTEIDVFQISDDQGKTTNAYIRGT